MAWVKTADGTYFNLDHIAALRKQDAGHYRLTDPKGITGNISATDGQALQAAIDKDIKPPPKKVKAAPTK